MGLTISTLKNAFEDYKKTKQNNNQPIFRGLSLKPVACNYSGFYHIIRPHLAQTSKTNKINGIMPLRIQQRAKLPENPEKQ